MNEVTTFIEASTHPLKEEMQLLREIVLSVNTGITEHLKWNAPSFIYQDEDRITMNFPPKQDCIQVVFHRGAKKKETPSENLLQEDFGLLKWQAKDRAVLKIRKMEEIRQHQRELFLLIKEWLRVS